MNPLSNIFISLTVLSLFISQSIAISDSKSCRAKVVLDDPKRILCVCSEDNCDEGLDLDWPEKFGDVLLIESNRAGARFATNFSSNSLEVDNEDEEDDVKTDEDGECDEKGDFICERAIKVDLSKEQQTIIGFGGAFTDSTGINIFNLSDKLATKLLESYFGRTGLQYNLGRVPVGGSDFSTRKYSYDDTSEPDYELKHWRLAEEDFAYKIKAIKLAKSIIARDKGESLKLFSSPWSPPAWMKTSNSLVRGFLIDDDRVYKAYAEYIMKFFDEYSKKGIHFWGHTIQNEPLSALKESYFFNSLEFDNDQMIKFVQNYLGPALEARGKTRENFKLMVGDDNVDYIKYQAPPLINSKAGKYIAGVAVHWYGYNATNHGELGETWQQVKDKAEFLLSTEACTGYKMDNKTRHVDLGSWERAVRYADDIINDLINYSCGWVDWNMALDLQGGPNWSNNFVDSPIIVDQKQNLFYKQPMYYSLGHFSRFFRPGSRVVKSKLNGSKALMNTAAVYRIDTKHVVVNILNKAATKRKITIKLKNQPRMNLSSKYNLDAYKVKKFVVEGNSITTVIIKFK